MKPSRAAICKAEQMRQLGQDLSAKGCGTKAFSILLNAAKLGDEEAQVQVGYDHAYGITEKTDVNAALRWWKRAYKQGSWAAAFNLGMFYRDAKEYAKAVTWFTCAVELGDEDGLVEIAKMHLRYGGDRAEGLRCLKIADDARKRDGLTEQARLDLERILKEEEAKSPGELLYREADLLDERGRYAAALPFLVKGAQKGDTSCQVLLGNYLTDGRRGVPIDRAQGIYWYKQAYEHDCSSGAYNLAMLYLKEDNVEEAFRWFERTIKSGDRSAHLDLAKIWLRQRGNKEKAIEHLKALFQGNPVEVAEMDRDEARTLLKRLTIKSPRRTSTRETKPIR